MVHGAGGKVTLIWEMGWTVLSAGRAPTSAQPLPCRFNSDCLWNVRSGGEIYFSFARAPWPGSSKHPAEIKHDAASTCIMGDRIS